MKTARENMQIISMLEKLETAAYTVGSNITLNYIQETEQVECTINGERKDDISVAGDNPEAAMRDVMRGILAR